MDEICDWYGITRQAHYQKLRRQQEEEQIEETILAKVRMIRHRHPRMGGGGSCSRNWVQNWIVRAFLSSETAFLTCWDVMICW